MISLTFMRRIVTFADAVFDWQPCRQKPPSISPASAHGLDKGDLVDLFQSGKSAAHLVQSRFAQEAHAFFAGGFPDFRGRPLLQNHLANTVGQIQKFMNRRPSLESRPRALNTSLSFVQRNLRPL